MAPVRRSPAPPQPEQELLLKHLSELRADFIRDLMRENRISGLNNNKDVLIGLVRDALRARELEWDALIACLDDHEPNGKQRVLMLAGPAASRPQYSVDALKAALEAASEGDLWDATVPIAAPEKLTLSSVTATADGNVEIIAIGRRQYQHRVQELESQVEPPAPGMEVRVYERVDVRAWVRAELDPSTGALNLRGVALPQASVQAQLFADFDELIGGWFPRNLFTSLDLRKAINALHDDERSGPPFEALVQAVGYDDASGRRTSIRGATATQSVNGASPALQGAIDAVRASGQGRDGNFYFVGPNDGGPPGTPIGQDPVRVVIKAGMGRLDFTKPHLQAEIAHVLQRVRVLAT